MMQRPPLRIVALFEDAAPDLPSGSDGVAFEISRIPPIVLERHLSDGGQPLTPDERLRALRSRAALRLVCDADVPPGDRLPTAVEQIDRLLAAGVSAVILPAAYKVLGPSALDAFLSMLDGPAGWLAMFVHHFVEVRPGVIWHHTHGMEHFGYPDLECRSGRPQPTIEAVVRAGLQHLMQHGGEALRAGDRVVAERADGSRLASFDICSPVAVNHEFGAYGVLQLVIDEEHRA